MLGRWGPHSYNTHKRHDCDHRLQEPICKARVFKLFTDWGELSFRSTGTKGTRFAGGFGEQSSAAAPVTGMTVKEKPLASKPSSYHQTNILQSLNPTLRADIQTNLGCVFITWLTRGQVTPRLTIRKRDLLMQPTAGRCLQSAQGSSKQAMHAASYLHSHQHGPWLEVATYSWVTACSVASLKPQKPKCVTQAPKTHWHSTAAVWTCFCKKGLTEPFRQIWPPTH